MTVKRENADHVQRHFNSLLLVVCTALIGKMYVRQDAYYEKTDKLTIEHAVIIEHYNQVDVQYNALSKRVDALEARPFKLFQHDSKHNTTSF